MTENENITSSPSRKPLVETTRGKPLPVTFQFASSKLCMPQIKFSLVDYISRKKTELRAA